MEKEYSHVLMIGGNARKSGKTTFLCNILKKLGKDNPLVALKVSLYTDIQDLHAHYEMDDDDEFYEVRETTPSGENDSSRYLEAGAMEGWFIAAMENEKTAEKIRERIDFLIDSGRLLIIESNRLRKFLKPGLFIMVNQEKKEDKSGAKAFQQMSDLIVKPDSEEFNDIDKFLGIKDKEWILKED
jgi:hypothetical protein